MHIPVLADFVAQNLIVNRSGTYLDATLGCGGHSENILKHLEPDGELYGIDIDDEAIKISKERLRKYDTRVKILKLDYINIPRYFEKNKFDGVLFDFGLSSLQVDDKERGFSFRYNSSLDMRMDKETNKTAADILNLYGFSDLVRIFEEYGEIQKAKLLTLKIIDFRKKQKFTNTNQLLNIVDTLRLPSRKTNPATLVFQALRIEVNNELKNIKNILPAVIDNLKEKGRLITITYHSGEDRIAKNVFNSLRQSGIINLLNKKVIFASEQEIKNNPRARSAKLRIIEKN